MLANILTFLLVCATTELARSQFSRFQQQKQRQRQFQPNASNQSTNPYETANIWQGGAGHGGYGKGEHKKDKNDDKLSAMDLITKINHVADFDSTMNPPHIFVGEEGDQELFEGDIVKTKRLSDVVEEMKNLERHGMRAYDAINGGQWDKATIPYVIARNFRSPGIIHSAIAEFKKYTCINFRPRRNGDKNYVLFMEGGGCSSMIGKQGGRQLISLAYNCQVKGVAIHEMMHAIGFFHEQSRRDRDNYITIDFNNIRRGMWYNFQKYRSGQANTYKEKYDKKSVMHYGNYAFSKNGRQVIFSKTNWHEQLGQRKGLSTIDIKQIREYYACSDRPVILPFKDGYKFCYVLTKFCSDPWVKKNCQNSCCKDTNKYCRKWAQGGYCKGRGSDDYMKEYCPKSCKYC